jgi:DNA-binding transcriptional ArsR family regulator
MIAKSIQPDVFTAIADPTRRAILRLLVHREMPVTALAGHFPVSRPAVSKHLRVLRQAKLVHERKVGRQRYYALHPEPLREVSDWIAYFDAFWQDKLADLQQYIEENS